MPLPPPIFDWNYTSAQLYEAEVLLAPPHDRYAATFETAQFLPPLSALPDAGLILRASNFLLRIFFLLCLSLAFLASASPPMMTVLFFTVAHNGSISKQTPGLLFSEEKSYCKGGRRLLRLGKRPVDASCGRDAKRRTSYRCPSFLEGAVKIDISP